MSTSGLIFMLLAWAIVGGLVVYSFSKILGSKKSWGERDRDEKDRDEKE